METTAKKKPKTMAELLMAEPGLGGLLSEDALKSITHTATKKPRPAVAGARTIDKILKPLTIAEMLTDFRSLQTRSPRNKMQASASARKKWNSSSKPENKTVSHTANSQMKHSSVRKVLNFQQPKPAAPKVYKSFAYSRMTMINSETPKFPKPEIKAKKSLHLQAHNTVRISGICNIPETPIETNKPIKNRMTIANKENINTQPNVSKKLIATPKSTLRKRVLASRMPDNGYTQSIPDTPLSNESWKSSCDASFLQNEQDIDYIESKSKALTDEQTLDNIAEISPPVSTPFADYRNVKDFFNNSNDVTENTYNDNTIMCFDSTILNENGKEESIILSLCNMLNKATVSTENHSTRLDDLIEVQKQTENSIKMIENGIQTLNNIKESQLNTLQYVTKLIHEKSQQTCEINKANTVRITKESPKAENKSNQNLSKSSSVNKTILKSPSYKVPNKYTCMRKKVVYKSMPNISVAVTPQKGMGEKALSMYIKMKERNNYLNTPIAKQRSTEIPDTPAITSHNLRQQLDKLYGEG